MPRGTLRTQTCRLHGKLTRNVTGADIFLLVFVAVMILALTPNAVLLWQGKIFWERHVVDASQPPQAFSGRRGTWFSFLRCVPAAAVAAWGAGLAALVVFPTADWSSTGCEAIRTLSLVGVCVLSVAGLVGVSAFTWGAPKQAVPPWLRERPRFSSGSTSVGDKTRRRRSVP